MRGAIYPEKQQAVGFGSRNSPVLRNELPVVVGFRIKELGLLNLLHEVIALVAFAFPDDATGKRVLWNASTFGQQFTATIAAIAVDGHTIPFLLVKRLTVAHLQDTDFLSVGFRYIHLIVNACSRVEVEGEVLESQSLLVAIGALAEEQQVRR